ncbi:hypothetical protein GGS24DRAFT_299966 [Hypoxylon argillaceum]|nr:hypothetical protein GGS24DRAFT_299966 [Hypoxylon argillaceum]
MATAIQIMQSSALTNRTEPSATTASVREHLCLFTHDLRRKQKRWQDGRLKYHAFNRRVMVYDERGNFVGDTHWREDYDLADGDDLELERGGVIIQVGECVGSREQDLSDLIDKRAQERAQRQAAAARRPAMVPVTPLHAVKAQCLPQKHLHDVIGTPSGHHGRAVIPKESPYEERRQKQAAPQSDSTRPAKRQRRDVSPPSKNGYAQNLFGATLTLSGRPSSQALTRHRSSKTYLTQEEINLPSSSSTSTHDGRVDVAIDTAQTPIKSQNADSGPLKQTPPRANDSQMSKKTFTKHHSLKRPELTSRANMDLLDGPKESVIPPQQRSKPIPSQENEDISRRSILNSRSTNRKLGKSREIDGAHGQVDSRINRHRTPPIMKVPKENRDKRRAGPDNDYIQGHMPQVPNIIDLVDDQVEAPRNQSVHDEPRTELRIKPRKRRGLLMLSEQHTISNGSPKFELTKTGSDVHSSPPSQNTQCANASTGRTRKKMKSTRTQHNWTDLPEGAQNLALQQNKLSEDSEADVDDGRGRQQLSCIDNSRQLVDDGEFDEMQYRDQPNSEFWNRAQLRAVDEQGDTSATEICAVETKKCMRASKHSLAKGTLSSDADEYHGRSTLIENENNTAIDKMPAPRLIKLGRRGINSKEVIGFIFDDKLNRTVSVKRNGHIQEDSALDFQPDQGIGNQHYQTKNEGPVANKTRPDAESQSRGQDVPMATGVSVPRRQPRRKLEPPNNEAIIMTQSEENSETVTTITRKRQTPLITNPATRGRKAAKPSDAAGQMPVCPLPSESVGSLSLHQNSKKRTTEGNPDAGSASLLPGFSRVNGGPWSREAHDLFDFKRPS